MDKAIQTIINFVESKQFRRFLWNTLATFLGVLATYLSGANIAWAVLVIPIINGVTKEINNNYLKK